MYATPQELSNTVWALCKLELMPTGDWLAAFYAASRAALPACSPQEACNMLWALAAAGARPQPDWLARFFDATLGGLWAWESQGLANATWALARLRYRPPGAWAATATRRIADVVRFTQDFVLIFLFTRLRLAQICAAARGYLRRQGHGMLCQCGVCQLQ